MLLEVLRAIRVLERQGGNYYLIGAPGVGRKTILKIAAHLSGKEVSEALPEEKRMAEWYFGLMRGGVEKGKEHAVILPLDLPQNHRILAFLEKIANRTPAQELLTSEDCEYAYS